MTSEFYYQFTQFLLPEANPCKLPFCVGGVTSEKHGRRGHNQDASCIQISESAIVGVVSDGCASTAEEIEHSSESSNVVGSKIISYLVAEELSHHFCSQNPHVNIELVVKHTFESVRIRLDALFSVLCRDQTDKHETFRIVQDYLTSTVIGFVVSDRQYIVFSFGDGVAIVDGAVSIIDDSGHYLSNLLLADRFPEVQTKPFQKVPRIIDVGDARELSYILVGSDGLSCFLERSSARERLKGFLERSMSTCASSNGFVDIRAGVNRLAVDEKIRCEDDSTLLLCTRRPEE